MDDNDQSITTNQPNQTKLYPKHQAYAILRDAGVNQAQASKMLGFTPANGNHIDKKINGKYDITGLKFIRPASKVIKNLLEGKVFGDIEKVKDSTSLEAAKMVYDRVQPIKRAEDNATSISFIQINIDGVDR